jgi:hypothetical protein
LQVPCMEVLNYWISDLPIFLFAGANDKQEL